MESKYDVSEKLEPVAHYYRHGGRNDRHCRILSNNDVMEVVYAGT
ncbi:hypothetical protein [Neglectibacter timonensis]|nr:hypothetical protein [Neglectibacter timonensis]